MLKIYISGLNRLCPINFLTLYDPCLGRDPYFGNHWSKPIWLLAKDWAVFSDKYGSMIVRHFNLNES